MSLRKNIVENLSSFLIALAFKTGWKKRAGFFRLSIDAIFLLLVYFGTAA
jgi:hypothetical protein